MRRILSLVCFCLTVVLLSACHRSPVTVAQSRITMPGPQCVSLMNGKVLKAQGVLSLSGEKPYCWIHYDSKALCSTCLLKQYYLWDELIDRLGEDLVEYVFVLEPRPDFTTDKLAEALNENYFSRPVYIDREDSFAVENGVQTKSGCADILIDKEGNVYLVGDIRNDVRMFDRAKKVISFKH